MTPSLAAALVVLAVAVLALAVLGTGKVER